MYIIQNYFICRPSDFTVSEGAGIDPRTNLPTPKWPQTSQTSLISFLVQPGRWKSIPKSHHHTYCVAPMTCRLQQSFSHFSTDLTLYNNRVRRSSTLYNNSQFVLYTLYPNLYSTSEVSQFVLYKYFLICLYQTFPVCPEQIYPNLSSANFFTNLSWTNSSQSVLSLYSYTIWRIEKYWFVTDLFENWF